MAAIGRLHGARLLRVGGSPTRVTRPGAVGRTIALNRTQPSPPSTAALPAHSFGRIRCPWFAFAASTRRKSLRACANESFSAIASIARGLIRTHGFAKLHVCQLERETGGRVCACGSRISISPVRRLRYQLRPKHQRGESNCQHEIATFVIGHCMLMVLCNIAALCTVIYSIRFIRPDFALMYIAT